MLQEENNLGKALGFSALPGPLAELVVSVPHLTLTIPALKEQTVPVQDFANMSLTAYAKLHTVINFALPLCRLSQTPLCYFTLPLQDGSQVRQFVYLMYFRLDVPATCLHRVKMQPQAARCSRLQ